MARIDPLSRVEEEEVNGNLTTRPTKKPIGIEMVCPRVDSGFAGNKRFIPPSQPLLGQ